MDEVLTSELLAITPARYHSLVRKFLSKFETDPEFIQKVSYYLASKIGDRKLAEEFTQLSPETKIEACIENIIIGLISGALQEKEVKKLIK